MEHKTLFANLLIYDVTTGKVLFLRRSEGVKLAPRTWCLPGGHVESNETPDIAAVREAIEEIGLNFSTHPIAKVGMFTNPKAIMYYFLTVIDTPDRYGMLHLVMEEHQSYTWVTPQQMLKLDLMLDLGAHLQAIFNGVNLPVTNPNNIYYNPQNAV